jgi:hypothetical protein
MRKLLIVLLAFIGFSSASHAQDFTIRFGPELTLAPGFDFGINGQFIGKNLARFDSGISLGLAGSVSINFVNGVGFGVIAGPNVNFDLGRGRGDVYVGLGLGVFGGGGGAQFVFGFLSGVQYQVTNGVNLFSNLGLIVVPGVSGTLELGADFNVSRAIDLYTKLIVGFRGTFGLGAGLTFRT